MTENLLKSAINLGINYCPISDNKINIIKQTEKPIIFIMLICGPKNEPEFSIALRASAPAEVRELVEILL